VFASRPTPCPVCDCQSSVTDHISASRVTITLCHFATIKSSSGKIVTIVAQPNSKAQIASLVPHYLTLVDCWFPQNYLSGTRLNCFYCLSVFSRPYLVLLRLCYICVCRRLSSVCTECIVAKRCVLEQKLLLTAYRKSYMRNRLVPK